MTIPAGYNQFGQKAADFTQGIFGAYYGPKGGAAVSFWTDQSVAGGGTGGTQVTDLLDSTGTPLSTPWTISTRTDGSTTFFYSRLLDMWADAGGPERVLVEARSSAAYAPRRGMSIALMGDSRPNFNGPPGGFSSNGTTYVYDSTGFWIWAAIDLGQRYNWVANTSVGGTTTAQHLSQIPTVLAAHPSVVHWMGHVNDCAGGVAAATTIANYLTGIAQLQAGGVQEVILTCDYRSTTETTTAEIAFTAEVNYWLRTVAARLPGVIVWDLAAVVTDPTTGCINTAYARNEAGNYIHFNNTGAQLAGQSLAALLGPRSVPVLPLVSGNDDPFNRITNGLFQNGSVPAGWGSSNGSGSAPQATISKVSRTDGGPGSLWQAVFASTGSDTGKCQLFAQDISSATIGHTVLGRCYFETGVQGGAMDWSNIDHLRLWVDVVGASGIAYTTWQVTDTGSFSPTYFPRSGVLQTPPIVVPAGATRLQLFLEIATASGATAGSGTVRMGQAEIHDVTACGY